MGAGAVHGLSETQSSCHGFALVELLVALLVFSIAIAGGLRAQLGALAATRDTLARLQAARLLDDLVQRGDVENLAALAPVTLPLAEHAAGISPSAALHAWAVQLQAIPPEASLCLSRRGALLEVAIAWRSSRTVTPVACAGPVPKVVAHMVAL